MARRLESMRSMSVESAQVGVEDQLQTVTVEGGSTKKLSKREQLNELKENFWKKQKEISEAFHKIVLSPIIWVILADVQAAIKNGSFETLLQVLKNLIENQIPHQSTRDSNKIVSQLVNCFQRNDTPNTGDEVRFLQRVDDLRKLTSSFSKTPKTEKDRLLEKIQQQFVGLIKKLAKHFEVRPSVSYPIISTQQCEQTAIVWIEGNKTHLDQWCIRPDITEAHQLFEELSNKDESRTIAEPKTLLQNAKTHRSLTIMLKRSDIFKPFLETILTRFNAFNEKIQPDLDTPLHYAVRNLDYNFLEWLQNQESLDINSRNKQKKTVLFVLCEQYDSVRQKVKTTRDEADQDEYIRTLQRYRQFITSLLEHGASLNICSGKSLLPYDILTKRKFDFSRNGKTLSTWMENVKKEEEEFFKNCEDILQRSENGEILRATDNKLVTKKNSSVTVELLEIFLRFGELELFAKELKKFQLKEDDVRKVISFLLHPAVEQDMKKAVDAILGNCGKQIFATIDTDSPKMKYRVELKGLLRKACDSGNKDTLSMLVKNMDKDRLLINDECILVYTLNRCGTLSDCNADKAKLLECAKWMASDGRVYQSRMDSNGNTALHAALKYKFLDIARILMSNRKHVFVGVQNNKGETPLAYATTEFFKEYLDECIQVKPNPAPKGEVLINLEGINPFKVKTSKDQRDYILPKMKDKSSRKYLSMGCIQNIVDSKDHKPLLYHPVIYTYILIEWIRYSFWHIFNLFFTLATTIVFGWYSIAYICYGNFSFPLYIASWCGFAYVFVRELLQWTVFGNQYFRAYQNWMDIANFLGMVLVLTFQGRSLTSALAIIIFAVQIIQLIGSLPFNTISTYRTMFRVVALNFIRSLALFCPLLLAFAYSFFVFYNDPQAHNITETSGETNFNKFGAVTTAGVKILVMATGEFEAASMDIDGKMIIIFMLFIFCVPMVIQNLINGLAISDIQEIRKQSEAISLTDKVKLLAQFETGLSRSTYKPVRKILDHLRRRSPALFFRTYSSVIKISVNDRAKIMIEPRHLKKNQCWSPRTPACLNFDCSVRNSEPPNEIEMSGQQNPQNTVNHEERRQLLRSDTQNTSVSVGGPSSKKQKPSKWETIPRIPGLTAFEATLEDDLLEQLLHFGDQNSSNRQMQKQHRDRAKSFRVPQENKEKAPQENKG